MDRKPRPVVDLTAQCACGSVSVRFVGKVLSMFMCSCEDCQRATGSGHSAIVLARPGDVTITGAVKSFARPANSGATLTRSFCPECGTPLSARSSRAPDVLMLPVGLFGAGAAEWYAP
ncbi:MAG TPA: GFA family protein, partial [Devosia sp.]|nr:GFA family protein [Devosia sp.]